MQKLEKGKKRDKIVNKVLKKNGYTVLRFWEHQIKDNINDCMKKILGGQYATKPKAVFCNRFKV